MVSITVDSQTFNFPDGWIVMKYDDTPYYRKKFQGKTKGTRGLKPEMNAIDLIATDNSGNEKVMYLIEAKDYRVHRRNKPVSPVSEFIKKVLDTLTGIIPTILCSDSFQNGERELRSQLNIAQRLRLIYHFEQPAKHSKLFPRTYDILDIQSQIRAELRTIDPHALVIDATRQHKVAWNVR